MGPRRQTAGTMGIISGVALLVLSILYFTSGLTPEVFSDPAKALSYMQENLGRLRFIALVAMITVPTGIVFLAGLAAALHERTPSRATATLYFGLFGFAAYALAAFSVYAVYPWLADTAAKDQVSAAHAYVAVNGFTTAFDGIGNFFLGLATLFAGWAMTVTPGFGAALAWFGVATGAIGGLAGLAPQVEPLYMAAFILPIIWFIWAGSALRKPAM